MKRRATETRFIFAHSIIAWRPLWTHPQNGSNQPNFNYLLANHFFRGSLSNCFIVDCQRTTHKHLLLINLMDLVWMHARCGLQCVDNAINLFDGFFFLEIHHQAIHSLLEFTFPRQAVRDKPSLGRMGEWTHWCGEKKMGNKNLSLGCRWFHTEFTYDFNEAYTKFIISF